MRSCGVKSLRQSEGNLFRAPEPGGSSHAARIAKSVFKDKGWGFRHECISLGAPREFVGKPGKIRESAAENHSVGIENIDDASEGARETVEKILHGFPGRGISRGGHAMDLGRR